MHDAASRTCTYQSSNRAVVTAHAARKALVRSTRPGNDRAAKYSPVLADAPRDAKDHETQDDQVDDRHHAESKCAQ